MDYQKKAFEVEISNGGPRGYETAITLKLPATWAEFHDALQKARIPDGRNCGIELTRSWWAGLSSELIGGAQNLYELNLFAMRLTMLTSVELLSMDGLLKMEQARGTKSIPIPRLINLTFNADCHILPDVFNDESLGAFLYENEMLTKEAMCLLDTTEPGSGYHGRLLEVFGEEHRQTIGGVFTSCGYMESNGESFEEVYRPGQMAYFDRSGSPVVLEVTMGRFDDPAYDSDKSIFLNLPAVGNAIGQAIDKVGANSEKECGFQCVECLIPSLREMINDAIADAGGLAPAEKMATLLKQKQRIWNEDAIIKYKAILEASGCSGLQDAIRLMEDLDQYELRPDVAQPWGYVALCGTSEHAMLWMLEQNPQIRKVALCLDHDEAGIEASGQHEDTLRERGIAAAPLRSQYKDWNADLKALHGLPAEPAEEHPQLLAADPICQRIGAAVSSGVAKPEQAEQKLPILLQDYKNHLHQGRFDRAMDAMELAAAMALSSALREFRQMGKVVSPQQGAERLRQSIQPHHNRGSLKNRADEIAMELQRILAQKASAGICGRESKESLAYRWLELAASCAKVPIRYEADQIKQRQKEEQAQRGAGPVME